VLLPAVVGLAGALGAVSRYVVDRALKLWLDISFPFETWVVNIAGSFILGVVATASHAGAAQGPWRVVIGVGYCGGLTTWSAASWETVRLAEDGSIGRATLNGIGGLLAACAAAGLGIWLALAV